MAKRKQTVKTVEEVVDRKSAPEPKLTRAGYNLSLGLAALGLIAEFVIAFIAYPKLPAMIPSWWVGQLVQSDAVPKWVVFAVFPFAQLVLIVITLLSPKDEKGGKVMESGKAWTVILLAALFIALQASIFHITK